MSSALLSIEAVRGVRLSGGRVLAKGERADVPRDDGLAAIEAGRAHAVGADAARVALVSPIQWVEDDEPREGRRSSWNVRQPSRGRSE